MAWFDNPLIGLDFETTGVDPLTDLPVQAALVWCDGRGGGGTRSWIIDPGRDIPEEAMAVHGISNERARREGRPLDWTARLLHRELDKAAREGVAVVAMNASFDATIAECLFERAGLPSLDWRLVIDPLVIDRRVDKYRKGKRRLDALCEHYGVALEDAHDAGSDAAAAVALARAIGRRWPETADLEAEELTLLQQSWHAEWARHFDAWCRSEGRPGLAPEEFAWPVRRALRPQVSGRPPASSAPHYVQLKLPFGPSDAAEWAERDNNASYASESRTMSTSSSVERGLTTAIRIATSP